MRGGGAVVACARETVRTPTVVGLVARPAATRWSKMVTQEEQEPSADEAADRPRYLVLSCMDYRHMNDVVRELEATFACTMDNYDHVVLAGASLGVVQAEYPEWGKTFWQHLEIALQLHPTIRVVVLLEHEDCGAYKKFYDPKYDKTLHDATSAVLAAQIRRRFERLDVRRMIMRDQGSGTWAIEDL